MIQTVLHARVPAEKVDALRAGYAGLGIVPMPPGLVRTQLIRDTQDPDRWRLESVWESREVLAAMRARGTPAGLLLFREVGIEPAVEVYEVVATIVNEDRATR